MIAIGKKIILILLITVFSIYFPLIINAQENGVTFKKETINPGSSYYSIKRVWEKGRSIFIFNEQAKIDYKKSLLKARLAELNYIVNQKILSEVESSSGRISYQAGVLTEELLKQNKSQVKEETIKEFEQYSKFLLVLRDKYNNSDSSFWRLIQYDIDSLKILSDRLR